MISLLLEPVDGQPIATTLPGQFIVLRLGPASAPALMRSYSLSGEPGASYYRVSVKREAHGAAGAFIDDQLQIGDIVQASAARGSFHTAARRHAGCVVKRRDRRDAGARDASCAGSRSIDAGSLVAARNA